MKQARGQQGAKNSIPTTTWISVVLLCLILLIVAGFPTGTHRISGIFEPFPAQVTPGKIVNYVQTPQ